MKILISVILILFLAVFFLLKIRKRHNGILNQGFKKRLNQVNDNSIKAAIMKYKRNEWLKKEGLTY
jgi:hypothetical protein